MKEYKWNEHGVCTNPDIIELKTKTLEVTILTAEKDGGWHYGFIYGGFFNDHCSFHPCSMRGTGDSIQNNAIIKAIAHIKQQEKPRGAILQKLTELYFEKAQLLLF